jgi:hypothetical protein
MPIAFLPVKWSLATASVNGYGVRVCRSTFLRSCGRLASIASQCHRMSNEAHHPTDPRGEFRTLDIQFSIRGVLAAVATQAQVVGPLDQGGSQRRQHLLGAQLYVLRLLTANTRLPSLVCGRWA